MDSSNIEIVGPCADLQTGWRVLYDGYATFYKREMTDEIANTVWAWINSPDHELEGAIALLERQPVGLAHYRRMPSPLRGADIGFLDDMFIAPDARGQGIAEALFAHLRTTAASRGWEIVRWITADDNYRARALYDRVAAKSNWNTYELNPHLSP
ncbi:MAG: GNAT family N-acetyltransferase [Gammaproteobacteria bacterium]